MATLPAPGPHLLAADQDLHWLRRFTFGPTPGLVSEVARHSRQKWFAKQLSPPYIRDTATSSLLDGLPLARATPTQIREDYPTITDRQYPEAVRQLRVATLVRQTFSSRQLFERLVHLWSERLVVTPGSIDLSLLAQRDASVRKRALGHYVDLLTASTRDPAMLDFLDANTSTGSNPNENLGRELLELHSVGTGHYTETDVHNSALVLTGLTVASDGTPTYNPKYHYVGPVKVMGWSSSNSSAAGGNAVIASYLNYLAHHKATAAHVSTMIARRFVSDNPDPKLIKAMADTYLKSKTSITAVLKTMVAHKAFADSVGAKSQDAYNGMIASVRMARAVPVPANGYPDPLTPLLYAMQAVGSGPLAWPTPDGPPDSAQGVSTTTVLARWNLNNGLATGTFPGLRSPGTAMLGAIHKDTPAGVIVDRAAETLLQQKITSKHRNELLAFLGLQEHHPIGDLGRVPGLLAMILDSPYAAVR